MEPRIAPLRNYNQNNNTRKCKKCCEWLDLSNFSSRIRMPSPTTRKTEKLVPTLYYRSECKTCSLKSISTSRYNTPEKRRNDHRLDPRKVMLIHARSRAKNKNLDFNITYDDIIVPDFCPLLNIPLFVNSKKLGPNSPTIDRIDNSKGYIKGNVLVISAKANTAKGSLSINELELLVYNLKRVLYKEDELLER